MRVLRLVGFGLTGIMVVGRSTLNFSKWDRRQRRGELVESVTEGSMPPRSYLLMHWSASLSAAEKQTLAPALRELESSGY